MASWAGEQTDGANWGQEMGLLGYPGEARDEGAGTRSPAPGGGSHRLGPSLRVYCRRNLDQYFPGIGISRLKKKKVLFFYGEGLRSDIGCQLPASDHLLST